MFYTLPRLCESHNTKYSSYEVEAKLVDVIFFSCYFKVIHRHFTNLEDFFVVVVVISTWTEFQ